jgi:hypothetical protein
LDKRKQLAAIRELKARFGAETTLEQVEDAIYSSMKPSLLIRLETVDGVPSLIIANQGGHMPRRRSFKIVTENGEEAVKLKLVHGDSYSRTFPRTYGVITVVSLKRTVAEAIFVRPPEIVYFDPVWTDEGLSITVTNAGGPMPKFGPFHIHQNGQRIYETSVCLRAAEPLSITVDTDKVEEGSIETWVIGSVPQTLLVPPKPKPVQPDARVEVAEGAAADAAAS